MSILAGDFRINFVPDDVPHGDHSEAIRRAWQGRLGLCRIPGWNADRIDKEVRALADAGTTSLVSLVTNEELGFFSSPNGEIPVYEAAKARGIRIRRYAIDNLGVPSSMQEFAVLVREITSELSAGKTVVAHCLAGLGRTGTTAAACVVTCGFDARAAIKIIRLARPGSVETAEQEGYVARFETWRRALS